MCVCVCLLKLLRVPQNHLGPSVARSILLWRTLRSIPSRR